MKVERVKKEGKGKERGGSFSLKGYDIHFLFYARSLSSSLTHATLL